MLFSTRHSIRCLFASFHPFFLSFSFFLFSGILTLLIILLSHIRFFVVSCILFYICIFLSCFARPMIIMPFLLMLFFLKSYKNIVYVQKLDFYWESIPICTLRHTLTSIYKYTQLHDSKQWKEKKRSSQTTES